MQAKRGFIIVPAVVGATPRMTTELRDTLGVAAADWMVFDPYKEVKKKWWYPVSLVIPLPGLGKRLFNFVGQIRKQTVVNELVATAKMMRKSGYTEIFAITWSLGSWFAITASESSPGLFEGIIAISPMLDWPAPLPINYRCKVDPAMTPNLPMLFVIGDKDTDVPNIAETARGWLHAKGSKLMLQFIKGAEHPFDQLRLRDSGFTSLMKNPKFNSEMRDMADKAVKAFLGQFSTGSYKP